MSDVDTTPPEDADRPVGESDDMVDPEAPTDSASLRPPSEDADRLVPDPDDDLALQEENAGTSLDQPSDQA
jgi:hypothetical protein